MNHGWKYVGILMFISLFACNNLKSTHPQAELSGEGVPLTQETIQQYADSVNSVLPKLQKHVSLVYFLDDSSLYVEKYLDKDQQPLLYEVHKENTKQGNSVLKYFLKKDQLVLVHQLSANEAEQNGYTETKAYVRNDVVFASAGRTGRNESELKQQAFQDKASSKENLTAALRKLDDALEQKNQFEMVFDRITESPQARYLILSSRQPNGYQAPLLVEHEDDLAREIILNPVRFRGKKLDLKWQVRNDNEAIYLSGKIKTP